VYGNQRVTQAQDVGGSDACSVPVRVQFAQGFDGPVGAQVKFWGRILVRLCGLQGPAMSRNWGIRPNCYVPPARRSKFWDFVGLFLGVITLGAFIAATLALAAILQEFLK
jgi:hypothetical protein